MLTTGKAEERKPYGKQEESRKRKTIKQLKLEDLSDIDRKVLVSLYRYRCLDDVLWRNIVSKGMRVWDTASANSAASLKTDTRKGLLLPDHKGVNMVRLIRGLSGEGLPTAYRIKMSGKAVEHQLALNGFVMEFEDRAEEKGFRI